MNYEQYTTNLIKKISMLKLEKELLFTDINIYENRINYIYFDLENLDKKFNEKEKVEKLFKYSFQINTIEKEPDIKQDN